MALTKGQKIALGVLAAAGLTTAIILWLKQRKDKKSTLPATKTPVTTTPMTSTNPVTAIPTSQAYDVMAFQKWYNVKGFKPRLVEDGIAGAMTTPAYVQYGKQFLAETTKK